ncbi:hypothetical protein AU186_15835 [Mycobacterium sp. GA-1999]|nr:hypothetical protein AU185_16145 [Mycobacterium sp. GA-0227b]KUH83538.1 hypothetical protein AU186_15835 [Mycobacterium sp. GA-1999]
MQAFTMQDIPNGLIGYTCFENRPLAIALVDELSKLNNGAPATSDQVQLVGRRINLWLATTALDVIAPDYNSDPDRVWAFVTERQPAPILADELPLGPDDGEVDHGSLEAARTLARRIIGLDMQTEQEAS